MLSRTVKRLRFYLHNRSSYHSFIDARKHETPWVKDTSYQSDHNRQHGLLVQAGSMITSPPTYTHTNTQHTHKAHRRSAVAQVKFYTCSETLTLGNLQCSQKVYNKPAQSLSQKDTMVIIPDSKLIWHLLQGKTLYIYKAVCFTSIFEETV